MRPHRPPDALSHERGPWLARVCILAVAIATGGCAHLEQTLGTPLPAVPPENWSASVHYSKVLESYGPPSKISALPSGSAFLYEYVEIEERQWGLVLPGKFSKYFKFVYASSTARTDVSLFLFDERGLLTGHADERFLSDPGGGLSFTLIFKLGSLSSTTQFTQSTEGILDWGMALMQSLPRSLNAGQSLDSGASGLETLRVDGVMGQRALEPNRIH